jgi:hypothetical protein
LVGGGGAGAGVAVQAISPKYKVVKRIKLAHFLIGILLTVINPETAEPYRG